METKMKQISLDEAETGVAVFIEFLNGSQVFEQGLLESGNGYPCKEYKGYSTQSIYTREQLQAAKIYNVTFIVTAALYTPLTHEEVLEKYLKGNDEEKGLLRKLSIQSADLYMLKRELGIQ